MDGFEPAYEEDHGLLHDGYESEVSSELGDDGYSDMEVDGEDDGFLVSLKLEAAVTTVEDLAYGLVVIKAPNTFINPLFNTVFAAREDWDSVAATTPLTLAPGLENVLSADEAPSIMYFKSLPSAPNGVCWGLYCHVMEKYGYPPQLYIGSGTDALKGVRDRLLDYHPGSNNLPNNVKAKFADGFTITHSGLLCWAPAPSAGLVPRARARFLVLEAAFTVIFHACVDNHSDRFLVPVHYWDRKSVTWEPLCTHYSLTEGIRGNLKATSEELEAAALAAKSSYANRRRAVARSTRLRRKHGVTLNVYKEPFPDRVRINATAARVRAKNLAEENFYCGPCKLPLQSRVALESHERTQAHRDVLDGVVRTSTTHDRLVRNAARNAAKEDGIHRCDFCNKNFGNDWELTRHNEGVRHINRKNKILGVVA